MKLILAAVAITLPASLISPSPGSAQGFSIAPGGVRVETQRERDWDGPGRRDYGPGSGTGGGRDFGPGSGTGRGRCRVAEVRVCRGGAGDGGGPRCRIERRESC